MPNLSIWRKRRANEVLFVACPPLCTACDHVFAVHLTRFSCTQITRLVLFKLSGVFQLFNVVCLPVVVVVVAAATVFLYVGVLALGRFLLFWFFQSSMFPLSLSFFFVWPIFEICIIRQINQFCDRSEYDQRLDLDVRRAFLRKGDFSSQIGKSRQLCS